MALENKTLAQQIDSKLRGQPDETLQKLLASVNAEYNFTFGPIRIINHTSQTLAALHQLGATQERLEDFIKEYQTDTGYGPLEKYETNPADDPVITDENLSSYLRTEEATHYRALVAYFLRVLAKNDLKQFLATSFTPLTFSLFAGAVHPLIQIGIGVKSNCPTSIAEGLAYAHSLPPIPTDSSTPLFANPPENKLTEPSLPNLFLQLRSKHLEFCTKKIDKASGFKAKIASVVGHCRADMEQAVWEWSEWKKEESEFDPAHCLRQLSYCAAAAYAGSFEEKGGCDFFLLHGVTGLWALRSVIALFDGDLKTQRHLLMTFLFFLFGVYLCQAVPRPLVFSPPAPSSSSSSLSSIPTSLSCPPPQLDEVVEKATSSNDEHISKVVAALLHSASLDPDFAIFYLNCAGFTLEHVPTPTSYVF